MNIWELITFILSVITIIMGAIVIVNVFLRNKWNGTLSSIVIIMAIVVSIMHAITTIVSNS